MTNTVLTYKGRPIADLTKNELVDAMTWAFQEIEYQRERADRFLNAAALAEPEAPINWAAYFVRQAVVQEQELKAALVEPDPEGLTDDDLWDIGERHLWTGTDESATNDRILTSFIEAAHVVLACWGRPAPQPVPVSERWPEFSDCDNAERVWCWNLRVGAWRLSRIDQGIHSHWLPARALPQPS